MSRKNTTSTTTTTTIIDALGRVVTGDGHYNVELK